MFHWCQMEEPSAFVESGGKAGIGVRGSTTATPAHISCAQQLLLSVCGKCKLRKHSESTAVGVLGCFTGVRWRNLVLVERG